MTLPATSAVLDRAEAVASTTETAETVSAHVHVLGAGEIDPTETTLDADAYTGNHAGATARLHAATTAVEAADGVRLHHPEPGRAPDGPWIVLAPLAGRIATVARGAARLEASWPTPAVGVDASLQRHVEGVRAAMEAARPSHRWYPVERDDRGVFTRGLTTFSLAGLTVEEEQTTLTFDVRSTPATDSAAIEDRFTSLPEIGEADFLAQESVEKATPTTDLRAAVETAADAVLGDWAYEWAPGPSMFSRIAASNKIAVGTDTPGATNVGVDTVRTCQDLLERILARLEGRS